MNQNQNHVNILERVTLNDPTLTLLDFCWGKISTDEKIILLIEPLKKNLTVTKLIFAGNKITEKGMKALGEVLKVNQTITELILYRNKFGDKGMQALSEALKVNQTITFLNITDNQFRDEGMQALSEALKVNQTITELVLYTNEIGDKRMQALSEALKVNQTITKLNLYNNEIGDKGMQALSEALKVNQTIIFLNLSLNQFKGDGIKALCEALEKNQTILKLDLSLNKIKEEGSTSLCEALKKNQSLTRLDLSNNKIGSKGVKNLGEALKQNKTLCSLVLREIKIGYYYNKTNKEKNVQDFLQSVKSNKSLIKLHIDRNKINKKDQIKIDNIAKRNLNFQKKLTKSVKDGNFQLFKELIQIEKIPLINQSSDLLNIPSIEDREIINGENTVFHTAIFHNQTEFLFYLLFANNEKTDQEIISKRNLLVNIKCPKTKKSVLDLLNPNDILIQDFKNYYNQFISTSSSSSTSSSHSNNNELSNNFPNKFIAEEEIMLMRIGVEWESIKEVFQNELNKNQKQFFLKWLYCPVSFNYQEKQIILEIFKLFNLFQSEKQELFSNEKLLNDFQNYIKKYTNSEKKFFRININKKKKNKNNNENKNHDLQIKSIQINKFILCLRSNLFRDWILLNTVPSQKKNEKGNGKEKEKETETGTETETETDKEKGIEIENEKQNLSTNQTTDYFSSIPEFYPFFLSEFYNLNINPFTFTFGFDNKNNNNNNKFNNNNKKKKSKTENTIEKSTEELILTTTNTKTILNTFNQNNVKKLIDFFLENDVSGFYQTNSLLFVSNLYTLSQKFSKL
ncbi:rni-like superfamily protein [Anaeramoeba flamelloides]|uniref:Rni-like superfamily protein n=1 Tax=Anaeramoeba flamelloides TaxID=1746091 RepID=A0AAV7Y9W5_9EUKA|nr:rni-like superfamily protein [Anaeramoeba flamelloides]